MCGIAGMLLRDPARRVDEASLVAMRDELTHRGPDDEGTFLKGPVGLGHRRLSIIDLASGHQPMSTEGGEVTIVYNGELYNYRELRSSLETRGVRFRTESDTEVILRLWVEEGRECLARLNGIFAFAIWDAAARKLVVARDRMGVKPLYYAVTPEGFVFASEIKALFRSGLVSPSLDPISVPEYFVFRGVAGEGTLFEGVRCLLPGQLLEVSGGEVSPSFYWNASDPDAGAAPSSLAEAADELDALLRRAVERQMMSDVPLGTFCSGGIDSSLVTALASRAASRPINTFSVGFHERDWDESAFAEQVSRQYGTRHHQLRLDAHEFAEQLPQLVWQYDEPLNFANSVQIHAISRLAKETVTVVLTGEGADELFGGYPRYYIPRLLSLFSRVPVSLQRQLLRWGALARDHRIEKLRAVLDDPTDEVLLYNSANGDRRWLRSAYVGEWPQAFDYRQQAIDRGWQSGLDGVSNLALLDQQTYLVSILDRQDKMSMAASVEARVPFLDNDVVAFANSLPLPLKQTLRHRKRVLKRVARRYLPGEVVDRRKSGFGVPLAQWMRDGALADRVRELPGKSRLTELFERKGIVDLVDAHLAGEADHSEFLWTALNFTLWREAYGV